tara:strand:- start:4053 stop:4511 length:459 start_codon:yes stop_codon:yes gene_type:complete
MSKRDLQLTENFKLSEFGYVTPNPALINCLQAMREALGQPLTITSGPRSITDHVAIYKKLETDHIIKTKGNGLSSVDLIDFIPWESRHLPSFETEDLQAVDITSDLVSGDTLSSLALNQAKGTGIKLGLGIGSTFLHIDTDRDTDTIWRYDY